MDSLLHISAPWLTGVLAELFAAAGLSRRAAETVAGALVDADLRGIPSHGAMLAPMYLDRLRDGSVSTAEHAETVSDDRATAVLDARNAMGILTGDQAMAVAVAKAQAYGIGAVAVRHAFHFGGAFRFVQAAAHRGCIGIAAANTRPLMPAPGGATPVVGNNPLAVGVPRGDREPLVLDMALSEVALGKIRLAAQAGRAIPPSWATDAHGTPTSDPQAAIDGMLLPAGGHKGFGLALIVDVLAGVLSGGAFGAAVRGLYADTGVPNDCAHFFLALDVAAFALPNEFAERVARLIAEAASGPRAPGVERLLAPGQLEDERHAAGLRDGIAADASVITALRSAGERLGVRIEAPEAVA